MKLKLLFLMLMLLNIGKKVSIDVSGFSEGLYAVILTVDGVVIDQKKIKVY